jgi:hypothetical protein
VFQEILPFLLLLIFCIDSNECFLLKNGFLSPYLLDKYNKEGDLSIWNSSVSFNYSAMELANGIGEKSRYEVKDILQKALYELWLQKNNNK